MSLLDESHRIQRRLDACTTKDQVQNVADEERQAVVDMQATPEGKTQAIIISNLKAYMLKFGVSE